MTTFEEQRQRLRQLRQDRSRAVFESRVRSDVKIRVTRRRPKYNTDGRITRPGGTPERTRGNLANTGQRAGQTVSESGGEVLGQARAGNGRVVAELKALQKQIIAITDSVPTRIIEGDPNSQNPELLPQYLDDIAYSRDTGVWYRWDTDEDAEEPAPQWVELFATGLRTGEGDPNDVANDPPILGFHESDFYFDQESGTLFRWNADLSSDPPSPQWEPLQQLLQGFTGDPNDQGGSAIPIYVDGAIAIRDDGTKFHGSIGGSWLGEIDELRGYIAATEDATIPLGGTNSYPLKINSIAVAGSSAATLTPSPAVGQVVDAGSQISLVVSGADGNEKAFTLVLERV